MVALFKFLLIKLRVKIYFLTARNRGVYYHYILENIILSNTRDDEKLQRLRHYIHKEISRKKQQLQSITNDKNSFHPLRQFAYHKYRKLCNATLEYYLALNTAIDTYIKTNNGNFLNLNKNLIPLTTESPVIKYSIFLIQLILQTSLYLIVIIPLTIYLARMQLNFYLTLLIICIALLFFAPLYSVIFNFYNRTFYNKSPE